MIAYIRIIGDERLACIPLKSYHRLQSAPTSTPRLIFQAEPPPPRKFIKSVRRWRDPVRYFTVSPSCYLFFIATILKASLIAELFSRGQDLSRGAPTHKLCTHTRTAACVFPDSCTRGFGEVSLHFCHDLFRSVTCSFCSVTGKVS